MHEKIAILSLLFLFINLSISYCAPWQDLHTKADSSTLAAAEEEAKNNSASGRYVLGLVYLNFHRDNDAYRIFADLLKDYPEMSEAKWGMAESLRRQHEVQKAENLLNEVIREKEDFAPALISLAYIKYFKMEFKDAVLLALKVIEKGKQHTDLSNYVRALSIYAGAKGMLAHYGGLLSKAVDGLAVKSNLDEAQSLQPDSPAVLFGLGSFYLLAPSIAGGNKTKAQDYLKKAIKVDPGFADAYVRLAQLARIQGQDEEYDFYMNRALELDPRNELAEDHLSGRCKFICAGGKEK